MASGGRLLVFLLLLFILSQKHNRMLAFLHRKDDWTCPRVRVTCLFREINTCFRDRDCRTREKCCQFSCGMKCLSFTEDPCEHTIITRQCPHSLTRWYFNAKENECFPIEYSTCTDSKNNFQSRDVCKRTCLAFGHGVPIKLFELEGEPFTVLI